MTFEKDLTITPWNANGRILKKGHRTLPAGADENQLQDAVAKAAAPRVGKAVRVDVKDASNTLVAVFEPRGDGSMVQVVFPDGTEVDPNLEADNTEANLEADLEADLKTGQMAGLEADREPTSNNRKGKKMTETKEKQPGIIDTIREMISRPDGATVKEIVTELCERFPDRNSESMTTTVRIQANKNATDKVKDAARGLVYYKTG